MGFSKHGAPLSFRFFYCETFSYAQSPQNGFFVIGTLRLRGLLHHLWRIAFLTPLKTEVVLIYFVQTLKLKSVSQNLKNLKLETHF